MTAEETKININFPVRGVALARCIAFNEAINALSHSEVRFGNSGNSTPHATLLMGNVKQSDISAVDRMVREHARELPDVVYAHFGKPYCETTTNRYVMVDISVSKGILEWRAALRRVVDRCFVSQARMTEGLHVTLAVFDNPPPVVYQYLSTATLFPASSFSSLDISQAGLNGAKLRTLAQIKLGRYSGESSFMGSESGGQI